MAPASSDVGSGIKVTVTIVAAEMFSPSFRPDQTLESTGSRSEASQATVAVTTSRPIPCGRRR